MKVSTKGRYALRLMLDIAQNSKGENISIKDISERQEISVKYLEQIVQALCAAGSLKSTRGAKGGYRLTKKAEEYTVGEILRVTEGSLAPVACLEDEENLCPRNEACLTLPFWEGLSKVINQYIDSVTLADILEHAEMKSQIEYCI